MATKPEVTKSEAAAAVEAETAGTAVPMSGRRREAARNDLRILEAAREVFTKNPDAPIAEVAHRADVGISALYSRYASKEDLLRKLCGDGLRRVLAIVESALADDRDSWTVFSEFMHQMVAADTSSLTLSLAGRFTPTEDLFTLAGRCNELMVELFERIKGILRAGVDVNDISIVFEQLAAIRVGDRERSAEVRSRYLVVVLDGLRADTGTELPGSPPTWMEIQARWVPDES
jgi:AcrR family transcriptional regulator